MRKLASMYQLSKVGQEPSLVTPPMLQRLSNTWAKLGTEQDKTSSELPHDYNFPRYQSY